MEVVGTGKARQVLLPDQSWPQGTGRGANQMGAVIARHRTGPESSRAGVVMSEFLRKLRWLVRRREKDAELSEELEFHLSAETEERKAAGLSDIQARSAAQRD